MKKLLTLMLLSVFAIVQASAITVYAKFNGNALNVHYWGNESTSWPGVAMDKKYDSNGDTWFTKTFNAPNFIFNLGNGQHQTGNIQGVNNDAAYIVTDGTSSLSYTSTSIPTNLSDNPPTNPSFDPTARKFAVTGDAVGGWNMPPSSNQYFTNNGDGTYTWTGNVSRTGFKLTGVAADYNITNWDSFNSGLFGKAGLVEGDNTLTSGYGNDLTMPVSGDVTLTISNVTDSSCKLNITVNQVVVIDPAFYLVGATNSWTYPNDDKFTESNGVFTLTKTFSGQFKIRDENGAWFGTGVTFTEDNNTTTLDNNNGNMTLSEESEYTLTIDPTTMLLTITGFPSNVQPVEPYATIYIDKESAQGNIYAYDQPDNQNYGTWPGASIQGLETGTKDNVEYYVLKFTHENASDPIVIFNEGNGQAQTANIPVADGDVLKYLGGNSYILNGVQYPPVVAEPYATIYIDKQSVAGNIYAYDQPGDQNYGGWPGASIQGLETGTKDNVEYYVFKFTHENASNPIVIFNEGQDQAQTANIPVADGDVLKYLGGNSYILNGVQYPLNRLYLMGLGDWDNGEEMTLGQDGKFTITKTMAAGAEFKFRDDTQWYGPVSEGNFEVTEEQVKNGTELSLTTDSGERNFTIPVAGEWTLTVDKANMKLVISGSWPFDGTKRKFAMAGPAITGANEYDYANPVYFTNNGDGTYTWIGTVQNRQFALACVGENDAITDQASFTSGIMFGSQTLIIGNNTLHSGWQGLETIMPTSGDVRLTISEVTESTCKLNITVIEKSLTIKGDFNNWAGQAMTAAQDGSFSITIQNVENNQKFKFQDQLGVWYGGNTEGIEGNYGVHLDWCTDIVLMGGDNGKDFIVYTEEPCDLTFTVSADMKLTITGWYVPGVTLAEALAGQEGAVSIKGDMKVVVENGSYAIVSDGEGNWLKLIGQDFHDIDMIYRVEGSISGLNLNPVMNVTSFHESSASVTVQPKSVILVEASEEEITALKPNEVATICGYYNATEHKLFANSPGSPQRKCMAVTLDHLVGTLPDGKAVSVTGVLSLNEPWETPAGGPARASKDDEGYLNYTLDATSWSPATGVNDIKAIDGKEVVGIYNVNGQQVKNADHGVYIIRYSDGTAAKVRF